jgi:hypothetical protein
LCMPFSQGLVGSDLSGQARHNPCRHPKCPSAEPDSPYLHHMRCECPARTASITGQPIPGWTAQGHMAPADWEGDVRPGFPHGSQLSAAARRRWPAYVHKHKLIRSLSANSSASDLTAPAAAGRGQP